MIEKEESGLGCAKFKGLAANVREGVGSRAEGRALDWGNLGGAAVQGPGIRGRRRDRRLAPGDSDTF